MHQWYIHSMAGRLRLTSDLKMDIPYCFTVVFFGFESVGFSIYISIYCETTVKQLFMRKTRNAIAFQYNLTIGWRTKGRSLGDIGSVDMAVQKVHRRWNSKKNDGEMITLKPSSIATVSEGCRIG